MGGIGSRMVRMTGMGDEIILLLNSVRRNYTFEVESRILMILLALKVS